MGENVNLKTSKTSEVGVRSTTPGMYVLAHAVRQGRTHKGNTNQVKYQIEESDPRILKSQNPISLQVFDVRRNLNGSNASLKQHERLPLNMIISKTARRKPLLSNNVNNENELDLSNLRKIKLPAPPWQEKESFKKQMQSAYLHNKRKSEEIQAMKAKMKFSRCESGDSLQRKSCCSQQSILSEPHAPQREGHALRRTLSAPHDVQQRLSAIRTSAVIHSEDPMPDFVNRDTDFSDKLELNVNENFMPCTTPDIQSAKEKFVFNPVILPVPKTFSNALEFLKHHDPPQNENSYTNNIYDSPGNCTTSSTSSGLTVAEETLQFTYCAERWKAPFNHDYSRQLQSYDFTSNSIDNPNNEWLPYRTNPDRFNFLEE